MLRFKQYIIESRRVLSEDMPILSYVGERPPGFEYSKESSIPEHMGNIGPYQVHYHKDHPELSDEGVSVHHNGKQIGVFPIYQDHAGGRRVVTVGSPSVHPEHRGKKAKVRNLASRVYGMIADKFGAVVSGDEQTPGSRSLWRNLARMRGASVVDSGRKKTITILTHPDHPTYRADPETNRYYGQWHTDARETNPRSKIHQRRLESLRDHLVRQGLTRRTVDRMKKLADFPTPRSFKKEESKLPSMKKYDPAKHDKIVYDPDIGDRFRLLVLGRKKSGRKTKR